MQTRFQSSGPQNMPRLFIELVFCLICSNIIFKYDCAKIYKLATDIDECAQGNSCDKNASICNNTVGSYVCDCKIGYAKHSDLECEGD